MLGHHVVADGVVSRRPDAATLEALLDSLVRVTGLSPITNSRAIYIEPPHWIAFQMIAESHISVHGNRRECFVDVFSCRHVNGDLVVETLREFLKGTWRLQEQQRYTSLDQALEHGADVREVA